ncbi:LOW QUALITY PROTEIN: deoxyribonuclease-1-like 2 [Gorilla gorilla gorilla]|uniref:LOW QUALITY PROTEIN: deoxyribonuclease-1-like 2 n=1 Tax=Gorilla gorilla gorilla TaxID=9595 RepID=UPI002445A7EE|nr:LOW QUALITY PROTEIN: deoxyribonuclease-1-like 2 [Gorilla gorilla gorilla]
MGMKARSSSGTQLSRGGGTQCSPAPPWTRTSNTGSCLGARAAARGSQCSPVSDTPAAWTRDPHPPRISEPRASAPTSKAAASVPPSLSLRAMGGPRALLAALWALEAAGTAALRIGAFNIQSFGDSKVSDPACGSIIAKILAGYDLALVQEVRDPDLSAVSALMEQINSVSEHEYSFVSSQPLGRDQYKEMYLFVYRKDAVSVVDTYLYPDPEDVFSREPFVVKFSAPGTGEQAPPLPFRGPPLPSLRALTPPPLPAAAQKLVLIPLHAAPHQAVAEIDALYDVYLDVIDKWGTDDMLFLGDFNADCSYVRAQDWAAIRLRSSEVFKWLIPDSADTTVGNSDCAYDRIVACGARLRRSLKPQSATVHDFQEEFGLDQTQALAISDHFPVEVTLKFHR